MSDAKKQFKLNLDPGLHIQLTEYAVHNHRSISAEMNARLLDSFEVPRLNARRERAAVAAAAMQGMLAHGATSPTETAERAVIFADALIAELDREGAR